MVSQIIQEKKKETDHHALEQGPRATLSHAMPCMLPMPYHASPKNLENPGREATGWRVALENAATPKENGTINRKRFSENTVSFEEMRMPQSYDYAVRERPR